MNNKTIITIVVIALLVGGYYLFFSSKSTIIRDEEQQCHPSYSGKCLNPNASDYDCVGGDGNGPYYTGKVRVIGPDVFKLDRDGDGWACE